MGLNDRQFKCMYTDGATGSASWTTDATVIDEQYAQGIAAYYTSSNPSLSNGQWSFLRVSSDGKLMVDTELTLDGTTIDNVSLTDLTGNNLFFAYHDGAVVSSGIHPIGIALSSQETAVDDGDAVRFASNLYGEQVIAGYDWSTGTNKSKEDDPLSSHHVEETLVDVTDGADGTYYYYMDMDGYKYFAAQLILDGGSGTCTVTVEATIQDDGTAPASCTYEDVSNSWFGAANWTVNAMLERDTPVAVKYIRFKVVAATGAANDADWTIYTKKLY